MDSIEERLTRLEAKLSEPKPPIEKQPEKIEETLREPKPKPKDMWDILQALSPLISGIVVIIVGYFLTGSVNLALQERQLEFSNAKEMKELIAVLEKANVSQPEADAAAVTIASFGRYAVVPLITELQVGGEIRTVAAEKGLNVVGFTNQNYTCEILSKVLRNRARLFSWETHSKVIGLLGGLDCKREVPALREYGDLVIKSGTLEGLRKYVGMVRESPPPDSDSIERLRIEIDKALKILDR